jgi:hypothetical protein
MVTDWGCDLHSVETQAKPNRQARNERYRVEE